MPLALALLTALATSDVRASDDALLAVAENARAAVVRVVWRDERFSDRTNTRNAIVVRADGLLLMAGAPPAPGGTLTVHFADGSAVRARLVAEDIETALTLLEVDRTGLPALAFRQAPDVRIGVSTAPSKEPATRRMRASLAASLPPLGTRLVMVSGDGAVAYGPVRAYGRHAALLDPASRRRVQTTGLLALALAAVDEDAGSPLLDEDGRVAALLVGRREAIVPEEAAAAARRGLRQRPTTVEAVAVPAAVAELVWPLLAAHKRVPRAALGIGTRPIEAALAEHLQLEGGHVIERLSPAGMGQRSGLQLHDVIVSVAGKPIGEGTSLHDVLLPLRPGTTVDLGVVREGRALTLPVRTGER